MDSSCVGGVEVSCFLNISAEEMGSVLIFLQVDGRIYL